MSCRSQLYVLLQSSICVSSLPAGNRLLGWIQTLLMCMLLLILRWHLVLVESIARPVLLIAICLLQQAHVFRFLLLLEATKLQVLVAQLHLDVLVFAATRGSLALGV